MWRMMEKPMDDVRRRRDRAGGASNSALACVPRAAEVTGDAACCLTMTASSRGAKSDGGIERRGDGTGEAGAHCAQRGCSAKTPGRGR
jgi:hypothetical protein